MSKKLDGGVHMLHEYVLIRSARRTLAIEIRRNLEIVVRAPKNCPQKQIDRFLVLREKWIDENLHKLSQKPAPRPEPTDEQRDEYISRAKLLIPIRVQHFGNIMGLFPCGISITGAKTRFGSCSAKQRLCFSWRLMQYPDEAIDYVVVHELSHLVHRNHGKQFYELIESVMPDYKIRRELLRD